METDPNPKESDSLKETGRSRVGLFSRVLRRETKGTSTEKKGPSRRQFLGLGGLGALAYLMAPLLEKENREIVKSFITFNILRRYHAPDDDEMFYPLDIHKGVLDVKTTEMIFNLLNLEEEYPHTINKESFFYIIQKPARIALQLYKPNKWASYDENLLGFNNFCISYFTEMKKASDMIGIDFIAIY